MSANAINPLKILGAILLIVGTSVGGGMLALPIATADLGFLPAILYLFAVWLVMTLGALLILEVNAWFPLGSHLISMAGATIGRSGQVLAWTTYLLLLYSLMSAYVAAGREVVTELLSFIGLSVSLQWAAVIFTVLFASIVFCGIRQVDWVNRIIMLVKLLTYFAMLLFAAPFVKVTQLANTHLSFAIASSTLMIMITSFGFAIIVPSLRVYFHGNVKALRRAIIVGSLVPLVLYLLWEAIIFSVLPTTGANSLESLLDSPQPIATLMHILGHISHRSWVVWVANVFTSVCVLTAFMGVSLCLIDFLADGLRLKKTGISGVFISGLTFLPPLLLALFAQKLFVYGLSFAGIFCVFLLILLPAWMAWQGRYRRQLSGDYQLAGGAWLLLILMLLSVMLIIVSLALWVFWGKSLV